ncbi:MAG TPA: sigma-70 family RNA polymerase sigma factor [Anaerolineales bacterium]|nr:sigma-70 family RNA polymerase sigma factor [Anaerolineales bacterium]
MDDRQSIHRMKSGDIGGLELLVRRYQVKAVRAAFLVTQDAALSEDVVQETFVRLFQHIHHFDESRPFEPYLMRSVVNAALNAIRQDRKSTSLDADPVLLENLLEQAASVEAQVESAQLADEVLLALSELSPRQRAVIVQRYYLEMSEREMAQTLDAAPGTIKWLLNAARTRLRKLLGAERSAE